MLVALWFALAPRSIYAFRGNGSNAFWRYNTAANTWATRRRPPPIPLVLEVPWPMTVRVHLRVSGHGRRTFWRYDTHRNTWRARATAPAGGLVRWGSPGLRRCRLHLRVPGSNRQPSGGMTLPATLWTVMTSAPGQCWRRRGAGLCRFGLHLCVPGEWHGCLLEV